MRVIIYTRGSTDEQANTGFSLHHQKFFLEKYCQVKGYEIVGHYEEDHSAKDFNRPEFQKSWHFIKNNRGKVDLFLFTKWDRFSRNVEESYRVIREMRSYGVQVQSAEQPLDLDQPDSQIMLAVYLVFPQVENMKNSMRTTEGSRRARKEGCWTGNAPVGYDNIRDSNGKSTLSTNKKAPFVQEAFNEFAKGIYTVEEVRRKMYKKGLTLTKQGFSNMLSNVVYAGKIWISPYMKEDAEIAEGLHEGLVSIGLYEQVQDIIKGRRIQPGQKTKLREELPLRGHLICNNCGGNITGSASRSRNGERHYYYHCNTCSKSRFRADRSNEIFIQYLRSLSIKSEVLELYMAVMKEIFSTQEGDTKREKQALKSNIVKLREMKDKAQDKYVSEDLSSTDYKQIVARYDDKILELQNKLIELDSIKTGFNKYLNLGLPLLSNLDKNFVNITIEQKQKLVGSIFPGKLKFNGKNYRTARMNEVLFLITNNQDTFLRLKKKTDPENRDRSNGALR